MNSTDTLYAQGSADELLVGHLFDHLQRCAQARGRWHRLHCAAEAVHAFLAPRFVTTLALTLVVLAGTSFAF